MTVPDTYRFRKAKCQSCTQPKYTGLIRPLVRQAPASCLGRDLRLQDTSLQVRLDSYQDVPRYDPQIYALCSPLPHALNEVSFSLPLCSGPPERIVFGVASGLRSLSFENLITCPSWKK